MTSNSSSIRHGCRIIACRYVGILASWRSSPPVATGLGAQEWQLKRLLLLFLPGPMRVTLVQREAGGDGAPEHCRRRIHPPIGIQSERGCAGWSDRTGLE